MQQLWSFALLSLMLHYIMRTRSVRAASMEISVGITGASGAAYAVRLLQVLETIPEVTKVHLAISGNGFTILQQELAIRATPDTFKAAMLLGKESEKIHFYDFKNFYSPIASG